MPTVPASYAPLIDDYMDRTGQIKKPVARGAAVPGKRGKQTEFLPWPAVVPVPPSSNNIFCTIRGGKRVKSSRYKKWLNAALPILAKYRQPLTYPVELVFVCREPIQSKRDVDNLTKALADAVVMAGVIHDDNVKHVRKVSIEYAPDEAGGGVAIWIVDTKSDLLDNL